MRFEKIWQILSKNEFRKNVLSLLSGTVLSQLIPFVLLPLLSRIFTEEQFGTFFLYSSAVVLLTIFVTLQFELSIVLPREEGEASLLFRATLLISFLISLFLMIVILLFDDLIIYLMKDNILGIWLYFIPLGAMLTGFFQAFNYYFNRGKHFSTISKSRMVRAAGTGIVQVGQGLSPLQHLGLIPGLLAGQLLSNLYCLKKYLASPRVNHQKLTFNTVKSSLSNHFNIPVYNTLLASLNRLSNFLPFFLLGFWYTPAVIAFYGLAHRVLSTPVGLIGQSIGQVFYQRASDVYNNTPQDLGRLLKNMYWRLTKIAFVPYLVLFFTASSIFDLVFGDNWAEAGKFATLLVPWLFMLFLNSPVSFIITILSKQKTIIVYDLLLLISRFASIYAGFVFFEDAFYSVLFYSATGFVFNLYYMFYILHISRRNES